MLHLQPNTSKNSSTVQTLKHYIGKELKANGLVFIECFSTQFEHSKAPSYYKNIHSHKCIFSTPKQI